VENPDRTTREYHYEDLRHAYALTGITIENGERFSWYEYDEQDRATASYHADDADRVDVYYEVNGDRVVLDPVGNATVYRTRIEDRRGVLDGISGPISSEGCGQSELQFTYDANMNVSSKTAYDVVTEFGDYDNRGRPGYALFAAGTPDAKRVDYTYDERFLDRVTRIVEPSVYEGQARITERSYDGRGNMLSETISGFDSIGQPVTRTTTHAWDGPLGQLSASDGPRSDVGDVTRYEYYADTPEAGQNRVRLKAVIDANGIRIRDEITYTATGKIRSEHRPNGSVLSYDYYPGNDRIRSLTESGDGLFNRISWEYHSTGEVRMVVIDDEAGDEIATRFSYDAARRLKGVDSRVSSNSAGTADQWVIYEFDAAGNVISETHGSRDTPRSDLIVERIFDAHQRLDSMTRGEVTTDWDYNPDGTLAARTDGKQQPTTYRYDAFKRLIRTEHIGRVVTSVRYDTHGHPLSVSDSEGRSTGFLYDDLGNRLQQDSPDSGITTYAYSEAGQVLSRTDAKGQTTVFSYDAGGRLTSIDRPGLDDDVSFVFDSCEKGAGRICAVTTGWGHIIEYAWNALGELKGVTTNEGQVGYTFGPAGVLRTLTYPSGRVVEFDNDGGGLPSRIRLRSPGQTE
jgi:YD repeat-containing protein